MKTIVFIGTLKSGSSREAIQIANQMGYFTVLLTNNEKQLTQREEYKDVHFMKYCNIDQIEMIKEAVLEFILSGFLIEAIVSFVDSYTHTACLLAKTFGVNHMSCEGIYLMENKLRSREVLKGTDYIPDYEVLNPSKHYKKDEIKLPAIMKSPQSTGSKDVYKVETYEEFTNQFQKIKQTFPKERILLEEYLEGPQYLVEAMVVKGEVYLVAIIEQDIEYINQHFIVMGYYLIINPRLQFYRDLKEAVKEIIYLHKMYQGSCHLELRYVNDKWKLIEINPRISGGGMNQLILAGYGINLVEEILKLNLNQHVNLKPRFKRHVYMKHKTIDEEGTIKKVTGKNRAKNKSGVLSVYVKARKGNMVIKPKSMGNRYAYVLATGKSKYHAELHAKRALDEIKFHVKPKT